MVRNKEPTYDENLRDVLIAVSVVAKMLANKLEHSRKTEITDEKQGNSECS